MGMENLLNYYIYHEKTICDRSFEAFFVEDFLHNSLGFEDQGCVP